MTKIDQKFSFFFILCKYNTSGPHYMREIGNPKICLHITNSHIKRPTMTVN